MRIGMWMLGASLAAACGNVQTEPSWSLDRETGDGALLGVWGTGPENVWAVGGQADRSLVLHGDGSTWRTVPVSSTSLLYAVYGFTASDIYAVGEHGLILHFDGERWTQVESGTDRPLFGLWGASGDDVWIVGGDIAAPAGSAVVLRGSHGSFHAVDVPRDLAPNVLFKVHGFAADDVMFVGNGGAVLRSNGSEWRRDPVPTSEPLRATWGRGAGDVYAVGGAEVGEVLHFDGQTWHEMFELPIGEGLSSVFTSADEPTIAVGPHSVIEIGGDGSARAARLPSLATPQVLHGVWGDGQGTTYVVGGDLDAYPRTMTGVIVTRR